MDKEIIPACHGEMVYRLQVSMSGERLTGDSLPVIGYSIYANTIVPITLGGEIPVGAMQSRWREKADSLQMTVLFDPRRGAAWTGKDWRSFSPDVWGNGSHDSWMLDARGLLQWAKPQAALEALKAEKRGRQAESL